MPRADSKPHSDRVREALDYALLRVGRELGYYDDILMYRGGKEALDSLVEQLQTAERKRDLAQREADMYKADRDEYDALLGRKMAERDRLLEQLETLRADLYAVWNNPRIAHPDQWFYDIAEKYGWALDGSNPASSPLALPVCPECAEGRHVYCLDDGSSTWTDKCRCTCREEQSPAMERP